MMAQSSLIGTTASLSELLNYSGATSARSLRSSLCKITTTDISSDRSASTAASLSSKPHPQLQPLQRERACCRRRDRRQNHRPPCCVMSSPTARRPPRSPHAPGEEKHAVVVRNTGWHSSSSNARGTHASRVWRRARWWVPHLAAQPPEPSPAVVRMGMKLQKDEGKPLGSTGGGSA